MQIVKRKQHSIFIWLLGLYLFLIPFDFYPIAKGFSLLKILILLPLVGVLFEIGKFHSVHKKSIPLLLYVLVVGLTLFYTINRGRTWNRFTSVALNTGIIMICALRHYRKEEIRFLIKSVVYSGWLAFVLCLWIGIDYSYSGRLSIGMNEGAQDPNYLTGYFFFSISYYVWQYLKNHKKRDLLPVFMFILPILLTGSRGGLIALIFAIFSTMFFSGKVAFKRIFFLLVIFLLVWLIMLEILPKELTRRFSVEFTKEDRGAQRFDIWEGKMEAYMSFNFLHQLLGYGGGTVLFFKPVESVAHNVWIESLIEYGLIGTILILSMYLYYIIQAFKLKEKYLFGTIIGYMVMMLSLSLYSYKPIWTVLLLTILISKTNKQEYKCDCVEDKN